jgi:hypothetical protein
MGEGMGLFEMATAVTSQALTQATRAIPACKKGTTALTFRLMAYPRNIDHVVLGDFDIVTWFYSPYPDDFVPANGLLPRLYVCPKCFKYTAQEEAAAGHQVGSLSALC